jgi:small-conductance mechanosensitive channel
MVVFPGLAPADALAALGIGSIAIGLAFKDIFENFFAGVLILWRFPFENGDFISCNGHEGKVVTVTLRNTIIRTVEGELVVLPNSAIYKSAVEVLTSQKLRRVTVICGVAYGEDIGAARDVIRKAVESCDRVSKQRPTEVFAQAFADSSINFEVTWWAGSTPLERRESRDEVVEAVKRGLDEAGIEIPFPQRAVWFKDGVSVGSRGAGEG